MKWIYSFLFALLTQTACAQKPENWTKEDLMQPAKLASALKNNKDVPTIICIGPGATIPQSIDVGPAQDTANLEKLKTTLKGLKKDAPVVVYCGCCPYANCPNVRPAMTVLKELKFKNGKLLDLPNNIKTNWIDKGYPVTQ